MPRTSILITDVICKLGRNTALEIAHLRSQKYHLILGTWDLNSPKLKRLDLQLSCLRDRGVKYTFMELNFQCLKKVRGCVAHVSSMLDRGKVPPLEAIVNCAEYIAYDPRSYTADGFHPIYQANYLGPRVLTMGLIGKLVDGGRVVNMGSSSGYSEDGKYFDGGMEEGRGMTEERDVLAGTNAYLHSKALMVGFGDELKRRLVKANKSTISVLLFDHAATPEATFTYRPPWAQPDMLPSNPFPPKGGWHEYEPESEGGVPADPLARLICAEELGGGRFGRWHLWKEVENENETSEQEASAYWTKTVKMLGENDPLEVYLVAG
ncbi:MAG: hypothetical protein M1839_006342 [Geoglossum umbratile]|nr:MAG: hypothetical protein M1839_006342 [Geoglossum umbratile]